ncbi:MAG: RluA family pseudouridine synthase [Bacteroidales bacterium]|nr:RluA family pseudouridine synthase [Bacteroidales bacterium]
MIINDDELDDELSDELDDEQSDAEAEFVSEETAEGEYEHFHFTADPKQGLLRLDKFLAGRLMRTSRTKVQMAADAGCIRVNGKPEKSSYRVKPGDEVSIVLSYPRHNFEIVPQDIPLEITYEDDEVIVVNKKAGMVVHPGHGNFEGTLVNALAWHLKDNPLFGDKTNFRPGLVHRIDKDTSGLLVIAKTEGAKVNLSKQFFNKTTTRTYIALVWGQMEQDEGTIVGNIGRSTKDRLQMDVYPEDSGIGKHAVTHYRVLERLGYVTMVECRLETGRTHQIRAHFRHIGHPLFSDARYGGDKILKGTTFAKYKQFVQNCFEVLPRQALHAKTLGFVHPTTNEYMQFDSPIPTDMQQCIERWRNYISSRDSE